MTKAGLGAVEGTVSYQPDTKRPWRYSRYYVKQAKTGELAEAVVALRAKARRGWSITPAPAKPPLDEIGGRWKTVNLHHPTREGTPRFANLRRKIPGVSDRMPIPQLREVDGDGLFHRALLLQVPPQVEFSVTGVRQEAAPTTEVMGEGNQPHMTRLAENQ